MNQQHTGRRIGQIIRMFSSDNPGEVGAAVLALNRALGAAGLDIHAIADIVEKGLQLPAAIDQPRAKKPRQPATTDRPHRPWPGRPLQMDEKLICDQSAGVFRRCNFCGEKLFTVVRGIGPHVAQLVCDGCGRGGRWLSRAHFGATS